MKRLFSIALFAALAGCAGPTPTPALASQSQEEPEIAFEVSSGDTKPVLWDGKEDLFVQGGAAHNRLHLQAAYQVPGSARIWVRASFAPTPENASISTFTSATRDVSRLVVPPFDLIHVFTLNAGSEYRPKGTDGNELFVVRRVL